MGTLLYMEGAADTAAPDEITQDELHELIRLKKVAKQAEREIEAREDRLRSALKSGAVVRFGRFEAYLREIDRRAYSVRARTITQLIVK